MVKHKYYLIIPVLIWLLLLCGELLEGEGWPEKLPSTIKAEGG